MDLTGKAKELFFPSLTPYEECIRETIIRTEELCLLRESEITPRKMIRVWDSLWWPLASSLGIDMTEAKELSIKASSKFSDYCKYDLSDIHYVTVAAKAIAQRPVNSSVLHVSTDILKVNVSSKTKNMVLVDFSRKNLTDLDLVIDPIIRSTAYGFYTGNKETVTYISVDITRESSKLKVKVAFFRPEELEQIGKAVRLALQGIESKTRYANPWKCKECELCSSKSLMKNDIR
jgi:hypothetical protein